MQDSEIFQAVGGEEAFISLVEQFYQGVESDPPLRALYPSDLEPGKRHLALFLIQRFGGPAHYDRLRGHPRLRMRHMGFAVDQAARDRWVRHMRAAVQGHSAFAPHEAAVMAYFDDAATFLINR